MYNDFTLLIENVQKRLIKTGNYNTIGYYKQKLYKTIGSDTPIFISRQC